MLNGVDVQAFAVDGVAVVRSVLGQRELDELKLALDGAGTALQRRNGTIFGARNLLATGAVRQVSNALVGLVQPIIGHTARAVRALFFDKTPEANWPVLWHQDLTIAVSCRKNLEGWGPWTEKAGVVHVEPPESILRSMVTVRLHLDDCAADNGPLRVFLGSHLLGRLTRDQIELARRTAKEFVCVGPAGSAVVMRPLLLHASSSAHRPSHRRVLHLEYASARLLPPSLTWAFSDDLQPQVEVQNSCT